MTVGARWKPEDDAALAELYATGVPIARIGVLLGRTAGAVTNRRKVLGIVDRRGRWSAAQDAVIVAAAAAGLPASAVAAHLGVPSERVRRRRAHLVSTRERPRRYGAEEDAEIRRVFQAGGEIAALSRTLGRSADALRLRARELGVHRPVPRRRWAAKEDDALRAGYAAGMSCAQIAASALPGRTAGAVGARATKLGLANYARRWTADDDRVLRTLTIAATPIEDAALRLVRTPEALRQRARQLKLGPLPAGRHPRACAPWTAAEDAVLRERADSNPALLSRLLGRSDLAVRYRLQELELHRARGRSPHYPVPETGGLTPGQRGVALRTLAASDTAKLQIARRLQITPGHLRRVTERELT